MALIGKIIKDGYALGILKISCLTGTHKFLLLLLQFATGIAIPDTFEYVQGERFY
jgi:hypothetical protein